MYQDLVYPEDLARLKNMGEIFGPIKDSSKENKTKQLISKSNISPKEQAKRGEHITCTMQSEWQQALLSYLFFIPKEKNTETYTKFVEKQVIQMSANVIISMPMYMHTYISIVHFSFSLISNLKIWITLVGYITQPGITPLSWLHKPTHRQKLFWSKYFSIGNLQLSENSAC